VLYTNRWGSQSFKITVSSLTRVEVFMRKAGSPPSGVVLSVRSSISGADLVSISKSTSLIPTSNGWVEFDFSDLTVTPGNTYYLVLKTTSGSIWTQYSQNDFCFKTYGI
jgi:hypothetical protein